MGRGGTRYAYPTVPSYALHSLFGYNWPVADWRSIVAAIAADNRSGATAIAAQAAGAIIALAQRADLAPEAWRAELSELARALIAAQPSMAPLFNLANDVLWAVEEAGRDDWREVAGRIAQARAQALRASPKAIAEHAVQMIPAGGVVLTHSASAAVYTTLRLAHERGRAPMVICTESRPQLEGQTLARDLAAIGLPVRLIVDAALHEAVSQADVVLLGADALASAGVINKIGSAGLAAIAQAKGRPVIVLAGRDKVWPAALSDKPPIMDRDPAEVWPDASPGVTVINRYFDLTPWSAVTRVVTEDGALTPEEVRALAMSIRVHPGLRQA